MHVQVVGPGCPRCRKLFAEAEKAVAQSGVAASLEKVEKIEDMMKLGVMATPALVIDGQVKCSGRVAAATEITSWLTSAGAER